MSGSQKNAVLIASMASVSMRVAQLVVTPKETMADIHTRKESWRQNTIHTMLINVMCATSGGERGNEMSSKLREAVEAVYECAKDGVLTIRESAFEKVLEALKEPLRNCDVGTAEEQYQRWDKYCKSFGAQCDKCNLDSDVHFNLTAKCFACWSQMPYEPVKTNKTKTNKGE